MTSAFSDADIDYAQLCLSKHKKSQRHIPIFYLFVSWSLMSCFQKATNTWDVVHHKMHSIVGGSFFIEACAKKKKALWSQYCSNPASSPPSWIIKLDLYDCIYWWGIGHAKMRSMQIQIFREVSWLALIFFFKYKKYLTYVVMYKKNFYIKIWILICFHVL